MAVERPRILSDDQVVEVLLAGPTVHSAEIAARFGCSTKPIDIIRTGRSFRALRIARRLGIKAPRAKPSIEDKAMRAIINDILGVSQ